MMVWKEAFEVVVEGVHVLCLDCDVEWVAAWVAAWVDEIVVECVAVCAVERDMVVH